MEEIIIISGGKVHNCQLAVLVKGLFPACKVTVASRENEKEEKAVKEGAQYVGNAKRI